MGRYLPMFFISLIPALFALAHDFYIYYENTDFDKTLKFASIGWTWAYYHPESLRQFINSFPQETTEVFIEPLLTVQMTLGFAALAIIMPALITIEYFLLRILFGWIGGSQTTHGTRKKKLPVG